MSDKKRLLSTDEEIRQICENPQDYIEIFHMSLDMICIADIHTTKFLKVNPAFARTLGFKLEDLVDHPFMAFIHPDDIAPTTAVVEEKLKAGEKVINFRNRYRCADGSYKWLEWVSHPMVDRGITFAVAHDITARREIEVQLEEGERFIKAVMDNLPIGIAVNSVDPEVAFTYMNENFSRFYGTTTDALKIPDNFWEAAYEDPVFREIIRNRVLEDCATGDPERMVWEDVPIARKGQPTRYVTARNTPVPDKGLMISTVWDVTRQKNVEQELKETQRLLEETQAITKLGGWEYDLRTERLVWTREVFRIHGIKRAENPVDIDRAMGFYRPDDLPRLEQAFNAAVEEGLPYDLELRLTRADGRQIWVRTMGRAHWENDRVVRVSGNIQDITEKKQADEERDKLQAQFLQAQKMESVGRLAGGVAHDFNNMLGVIIGHTEIALGKIGPDHPVHAALEQVQKAAGRSADLTRQLLAFARKQAVAPKVLDLNRTVEGMLNILRRLIGEDTELVWVPGEDLWPVKIDPGQIDQILANLCVNARDAIAGPGRITIETANRVLAASVEGAFSEDAGGDYLALQVSDTGCGMDGASMGRLFEPFFTTKGPGKGTGLGLSTVYGIVKQNGGQITVDSVPGEGTRFAIFLPRYQGEAPIDKGEKAKPKSLKRGRETVLLVEDEPAILGLCEKMLARMGYQVLSAGSPEQALSLALAWDREIHLMITDVIMPGMNGKELVERLLVKYPGLERLFMSGYPADVISVHGVLEDGVHFIQKPFTAKDLSHVVRSILDPD